MLPAGLQSVLVLTVLALRSGVKAAWVRHWPVVADVIFCAWESAWVEVEYDAVRFCPTNPG